MEFIAFIVTVLVGFVAESLLGNWLNWPESVKELSVKVAAFVGSGISVQPLARV